MKSGLADWSRPVVTSEPGIKMAFFVYLLRNPEGRFYIGYTANLRQRLEQHYEGKVFWTKSRGPWELVYNRPFEGRAEAVAEERRLKGLKSKKALECLVAQQVEVQGSGPGGVVV